jgi:hypothetical protein
MFVIIKKGEIVGTKFICTITSKVLMKTKVLKEQIGYSNICSSAQDHIV